MELSVGMDVSLKGDPRGDEGYGHQAYRNSEFGASRPGGGCLFFLISQC